MPRGLAQVCGHCTHRSNLRELGEWIAPSALAFEAGRLRTLRTDGARVVYEGGISEADPAEAVLYLIDAEMRVVEPAAYPLLPLEQWLA
jgi:hypothetical protein